MDEEMSWKYARHTLFVLTNTHLEKFRNPKSYSTKLKMSEMELVPFIM